MDRNPIQASIDGTRSLVGDKTNKLPGSVTQEDGATGEFRDELTIDTSDEELLAIAQQDELDYRETEGKVSIIQKLNKENYLGRPTDSANQDAPIASNLLFEAVETFLPAALSKNPEPVVWTDNTEEGTKVASDVKAMLQYHADTLLLRPKLQSMTRRWLVDLLGVLKHGWNEEVEDIVTEVRDAKNFVFSKGSYVDCYGDLVGRCGEKIKISADKLVDLFPNNKAFITIVANGKMGTELTYTEWQDDEVCFYTFKGIVLDKHKNANFNYGKDKKNHFARPKKPYTFLSVFSFGDQVHDVTSLIEQNINNQRRVSRRTEQIDYNLSATNNSIALSESNFNQETGKQFALGRAKGHPLLVPEGVPLENAFREIPIQGVDQAHFTELETSKADLRSIFGVQGISAQQPNEETTARGMILNQSYDNTRIGGGIGDALEQVADSVFNWWVQLYYVHYTEEHFASIMGQMKATEYVTLQNSDLDRRIVVSVSPDSMKPKDEITEMNQAQTLYDKGAIGPVTLLTILNFPDPKKAAEDGALWQVDKKAYIQLNFPELSKKLQALQAQLQPQQTTEPGAEAPPVQGESVDGLAVDPASAALSNVPLPA